MDTVVINDRDYQEVLVAIGYPFFSESDIELTKEQVINLAILPSLREFYNWFPKPLKEQYQIENTFTYDFPNEDVFDVLDSRLTGVVGTGATPSLSPFVNAQYIKQTRGGLNNMYGTPYEYGTSDALFFEKSARQARVDSLRAFKVDVNLYERTITGYTNSVGQLSIIWACFDEDFSHVPYKFKQDVIDLSQSYLLRNYTLNLSQMDSDVPNQFNYSDLRDEGDRLRDKVLTRWKGYTKPVILRG